MKINAKTRHSTETPGCLELAKAYLSKFPLANEKKTYIQELVDKKIIIPTFHYDSFFKYVLALC